METSKMSCGDCPYTDVCEYVCMAAKTWKLIARWQDEEGNFHVEYVQKSHDVT